NMGSWSTVAASGDDLSDYIDDHTRYFQYKISLATSDPGASPVFRDISIDWSVVGTADHSQELITLNSISEIYPSPATSSVVVSFDLAFAGRTRLDVFDIAGRIVTTLANEDMTSGSHSLTWDLRDTGGAPVPSGLYAVRITSSQWTGLSSFVITR
ncbi:MAG: T9SS type A sorting domain-containing protein, partial [Candidatus Aegiribacteria sp.]|nr:T9SS type A sorting domain-containing protein [Candidatus Aegiribacteria sp.]